VERLLFCLDCVHFARMQKSGGIVFKKVITYDNLELIKFLLLKKLFMILLSYYFVQVQMRYVTQQKKKRPT
jgi:predicted membrane protein